MEVGFRVFGSSLVAPHVPDALGARSSLTRGFVRHEEDDSRIAPKAGAVRYSHPIFLVGGSAARVVPNLAVSENLAVGHPRREHVVDDEDGDRAFDDAAGR